MTIINKILESSYFEKRPPVLIDIGASGEIHAKWKSIASHSICIAFDADDREFNVTENVNKTFKKLYTFNRIVTAEPMEEADFYLTKSPFCSSLLEPTSKKLEPWSFSKLFEVEKKLSLPVITIENALKQVGIEYIDWFKTDTQGTDLRLFTSLSNAFRSHILCAEFEPGIIDAYSGEDKLYEVMKVMHDGSFWLSSMDVKGTQRLHHRYSDQLNSVFAKRALRNSPGWAELLYLRQADLQDERSALLLYIFALIENQFGFAIEVADAAISKFNDPIFKECKDTAWKKIQAEKMKSPLVIMKRKINKLFRNIHD